MRIVRILILSLLFGIISNIIQSCCDNKPYLWFESLVINTPRYYTQSYMYPDSIIPVEKFYLGLYFKNHTYATGLVLFNNAYATEPCPEGEKGSKESIKSISIKSNSDIDNNYMAGSELSSIFKYNNQNDGTYQDTVSSHWHFIDANYLETLRLNRAKELWLDRKTVKDSAHIFTVTVTLSDNREMMSSTNLILLK